MRDELARRLAVINGETEDDWTLYLNLAEECLRQMAYARVCGIDDYEKAKRHNQLAWDLKTRDYKNVSLTGDLSIAPLDWKPS